MATDMRRRMARRPWQLGRRSPLWMGVLAIALGLELSLPAVVSAQSQDDDAFPPNPLELTEPDPLLPNPPVERPLSPLEIYDLRIALNRLNRDAQIALNSGNPNEAFDIWNRELRLRRVLGFVEEVPALGRVGGYAWSEENGRQVRLITGRLEEIEAELLLEEPPNYALLLTIADSYQNLRAYRPAVRVYEVILAEAREQGDVATEEATLRTLAELHEGWFYYVEAGIIYEELLDRAIAREDRFRIEELLNRLAYVYRQSNQYEAAIGVLNQLVEINRIIDPTQIPPLKLQLGNSYRALGFATEAATHYQESYVSALAQRQYGYASDALIQMARLYRDLGQLEDALVVYRLLLGVDQESYDRLGMMETFAEIGAVYEAQEDKPRAIANYRQALLMAEELSYPARIDTYTARISALGQPGGETAADLDSKFAAMAFEDWFLLPGGAAFDTPDGSDRLDSEEVAPAREVLEIPSEF